VTTLQATGWVPSVTFVVVLLTFTVINPEYHFEILQENLLPDHVSIFLIMFQTSRLCSNLPDHVPNFLIMFQSS